MSGRKGTNSKKLVIIILGLFAIAMLAGCAPQNLNGKYLSDEDMATCDATAAAFIDKVTFIIPDYMLTTQPYLKTPGEVGITTPLTASVLPFGPVKIEFTLPPADPNIKMVKIGIYVTPISTENLTSLISYPYDLIPANAPKYGITWNPAASGKYIFLVLVRNFKTGGNPNGYPHSDFGPPSVAYSCVKIESITWQGQTANAVVVQPLPIYPTLTASTPTATTFTKTWTPTPANTLTPTLTLTNTPTLVPSKLLPTKTFTLVPTQPQPTEVDCSSYLDARSCEANSACYWYTPPTGGPGECKKK